MTRLSAVIAAMVSVGLWGCNPGTAVSALIRLDAELAGARCANGGVAVLTGLDQNQNGALDDAEIDQAQTRVVCNGAPGAAGETGPAGDAGVQGGAGLNALSKLTPEPSGTNCRYGGFRIDVGVDADGDGSLDTAEIAGTQYVCDQASVDAIFFGDLTIRDASDLALLNGIQVVAGTLRVVSTPTNTLSLPDLRVVSGQLLVEDPNGTQGDLPASISSLSLPELRRATLLKVNGTSALTTLALPKLERLEDLFLFSNAELTQLSMPSLSALGSLQVGSNPKLASVSLPALQATTDLSVQYNDVLATLSLGALRTVARDFGVYANPVLSQCAVLRLLSALEREPTWRYTTGNDEGTACTLADACSTRTVTGLSGTLRRCVVQKTFADAKTDCATFGSGAALAWFTSASEWAAMKAAVASGPLGWASWIGYSDAATDGTWAAVGGFTGYDVTAETDFWNPGEPNGGTAENAVELTPSGLANDQADTLLRSFICRVP